MAAARQAVRQMRGMARKSDIRPMWSTSKAPGAGCPIRVVVV
jgi:hypothetical protein